MPVVLILLVCAGPVIAALLLYNNPGWMSATTIHGNLIAPVVILDRDVFTGLDEFSKENIDQYKGRWVIMHIIGENGCDAVCKAALQKTRKIRLMLDKDILRTRRLVVVNDKIALDQLKALWSNDQTLIRVRSKGGFFGRLSRIMNRPIEGGMVFLMDPLGNLLMWYGEGVDPYAIKKDLKRLLRVSQIG